MCEPGLDGENSVGPNVTPEFADLDGRVTLGERFGRLECDWDFEATGFVDEARFVVALIYDRQPFTELAEALVASSEIPAV